MYLHIASTALQLLCGKGHGVVCDKEGRDRILFCSGGNLLHFFKMYFCFMEGLEIRVRSFGVRDYCGQRSFAVRGSLRSKVIWGEGGKVLLYRLHRVLLYRLHRIWL